MAEEQLALLKKDFEKEMGNVRREFEVMKVQHRKFTNQVIEWLRHGKEDILRHEKFLDGIKHTNENVEEILGNVLLAIRQNEYLQAWYPPQQEHPEMKVVGIHPANLDSREMLDE